MKLRNSSRFVVACGLALFASLPAVAAGEYVNHGKGSKAVHLPDRGQSPSLAPQALPGKPVGYKVNLNKADLRELQLLPFVGAKVAAGIVAARPIKKVDDLLKVKGIPPLYLSAIKPHVKL
jgi:DNA uptake protein ComE-like DNA-binding protein